MVALTDQAITKVRPPELCLARMDAAETTQAFIAADEEFHRIIATASGNSTPASRIEHVSAVSEGDQWRTHMVEVDGAAETQ